ncbi:hypothetical protein Misp05_23230 [Micromonospora sp. NBRC 107095]|nr:hypothetical protein Misp05_23230 [Micromonospora sp. NBRC 107095]
MGRAGARAGEGQSGRRSQQEAASGWRHGESFRDGKWDVVVALWGDEFWERSQLSARCFQRRYLMSIDLIGWVPAYDEGGHPGGCSPTRRHPNVRLAAPRAVVLIS